MIINACSFTKNGRMVLDRLVKLLCNDIVQVFEAEEADECVRKSFEIGCPLIFAGACGIAVRKIAPYVTDKLTDPAVIDIDDKGNYVIPILSGHFGGANALASQIADLLNATAVITTATDVSGKFSVDVFARENHLGIVNREGIKKVSGKVLNGEKLTVHCGSGSPDGAVDILISPIRD